MSSSISQVKYWLGSAYNSENGDADGKDTATYLSYYVFLGLSVVGGFFALDHLYLRSPTTFLAKFFVNVFCFGVWWFYDALQAVFHSDVIKLYGLGIPGWGPTGIAAGVLTKDIPDKKHLRFLLYTLALFFGGFIGLDSFLVGDRQTGIIRLLCGISVILSPLALVWWAYEIFQYFTNTEEVINHHFQFFGAPEYSASKRWTSRFPLLGLFFSPFETLKTVINNIVGPSLLEPLTRTADAAVSTVEHAVSAVDNTVQLGREVIAKSSEIVDQVGKTIETVSQASTLLPAASLYAAASQGLKGPSVQSGGSNTPDSLNPLGYFLLGTLAFVAIAGWCITFYRSRNVGQQSGTGTRKGKGEPADDVPPEPSGAPSESGIL